MSGQVCRRVQLLRSDGLSRSRTNLQRYAEHCIVVLVLGAVYDVLS